MDFPTIMNVPAHEDTVNGYSEALFEATNKLGLIDTHEHMLRNADEQYPSSDLFDLIKNTYYPWAGLVSAGMPSTGWDDADDDEKKWSILKEFLPHVSGTGIFQGLMRGIKSIHGHDAGTISDSDWESLNNKIKNAYKDPLWPERVLRERVHIQWAINDVDGFNMNRSLFLPAIKFDYLLRGNSENGRRAIKEMDGETIRTFNQYTDFLDVKLDQIKSQGAVALKTVTPYYRGFDYEAIPLAKARSAFRQSGKPTPAQEKTIEDFAFHYIIQKASQLDLPVQIHTGLLAWNQVYLPHCNPVQLNKIFLQYPGCKFVLFHGGYPYAEETGVLARTFSNVYLDFCWLPWITFYGTKRSLHEWLEIVPHNKLMWGGDSHRAECVQGHWLIAQEVVIRVLSEKLADKTLNEEEALRVVKGIFRNNAIRLFTLDAEKQ